MLSYLHDFHAGNHADVLKHWLLLECVQYMQLKDKPFDYIDTHAGAGLYRIDSKEAKKTGEIDEGILKLNWSDFPELDLLWNAIRDDIDRRRYPGSPQLVKRMLRSEDKAWFFEMHPKAIESLRAHYDEKHRSHVRQEDGFAGLLSLLPTKSARALVLIDSAYEVKQDYRIAIETLIKAHKKMSQATMLLWYPVVNRQAVNQMESQIKRSTLKDVQLFEIGIADDQEQGMTASGLIVVNSPWTLADKFKKVAERLSQALSKDGVSRWRWEQLVKE